MRALVAAAEPPDRPAPASAIDALTSVTATGNTLVVDPVGQALWPLPAQLLRPTATTYTAVAARDTWIIQ